MSQPTALPPAKLSSVAKPPSESVSPMNTVPLRDWFAGQALVGLIPSPARPGVLQLSTIDMARYAYQYADAMMKARDE
jgi:hypothetical protein